MSKKARARRRALAEAIKKPIATGMFTWEEFNRFCADIAGLETGAMVRIEYLDGNLEIWAKPEFGPWGIDHFRHSLTEGMLGHYGWGAKLHLAAGLPIC